MLLNYSDFNPDCVRTIRTSPLPAESQTSLSVTVASPSVEVIFHVPKPNMRHPHEIGDEFIGTFWTRKVHPEIFSFQFDECLVRISQEGGSLAPLNINVSTASLEMNYQETEAASKFQLIQARRLSKMVERGRKSYAVEVDITVCMDESVKLQGKYNSNTQKLCLRVSTSTSTKNISLGREI